MLQWLVASIHLLALGIGLGAVVTRAVALRRLSPGSDLSRVFVADSMWGLAALLWISTGLWRAFGGLEKGTEFYLQNDAFWIKMALLVLILLLEIWPMATLVRWRAVRVRGGAIDLSRASTFGSISMLQALLVIAMVFAATAMARGIGY